MAQRRSRRRRRYVFERDETSVRATGTTRWRFALRKALATGRYTVYSRAVIGAGFPEASFAKADRNRVQFRIH